MKIFRSLCLVIAVPVLGWGQAAVVSPAKRQTVVDAAKQLVATRAATAAGQIKDPFHPEIVPEESSPDAGEAQPIPSQPGTRSERDLLASIAAAIKPSGFVVLSGEPTLIFGQKRVKPGGTLTITFEGVEYTLQITAITRTSFTLRLNREEYTRPIK